MCFKIPPPCLRSRKVTGARGEWPPAPASRRFPRSAGVLGGPTMLRMALFFCVLALIAAMFGFGLVANMSFDIARIIFFVFIVLAILSLFGGVLRRPPA